jgi:hypothetical protein
MRKVPFTPAGILDKQAELYALDQLNLDNQAALILGQFVQWVKDNFTLTTSQSDYLDGIDGDFFDLLRTEISDTVSMREPITLVVGSSDTARSSKFFRIRKCRKGTYSKDSANEVSSELELSISYE